MYKPFTGEDAVKHTKRTVLTIPEGFTHLDEESVVYVTRHWKSHVRKLIIPSTIESIDFIRTNSNNYGLDDNRLVEIVVSKDNKHYASHDGVLFNKDMKTLIYYPCRNARVKYDIPNGVEVIKKHAFLNTEYLDTISFPSSLKIIEREAFTESSVACFPNLFSVYRKDFIYTIEIQGFWDNDYFYPGECQYITVNNRRPQRTNLEDCNLENKLNDKEAAEYIYHYLKNVIGNITINDICGKRLAEELNQLVWFFYRTYWFKPFLK